MKGILIVLLVMALGVSLDGQLSAQSKQKAPNFALKSADGKTYELSKMKGKVVVVNFWATWCGPCRKEIPDFIEIYKRYESKGLEIIGIALDEGGWEDVKPYVKESKINYPIVLGGRKEASDYGNVAAIPTTFIIDKNGFIVDRHIGVMTKAQLESKIKPLL